MLQSKWCKINIIQERGFGVDLCFDASWTWLMRFLPIPDRYCHLTISDITQSPNHLSLKTRLYVYFWSTLKIQSQYWCNMWQTSILSCEDPTTAWYLTICRIDGSKNFTKWVPSWALNIVTLKLAHLKKKTFKSHGSHTLMSKLDVITTSAVPLRDRKKTLHVCRLGYYFVTGMFSNSMYPENR